MKFGKQLDAGPEGEKAKESLAEGGPVEGFGISTGEDKNNPINEQDLESIQKGSAQQSAEEGQNEQIGDMLAQAHTESVVGENSDAKGVYSSHPIARFKLGRFKFDNGVLTLDNSEDVEEFEKLLASADLRTQNQVRKIDVAAGNKIAEDFLKSQTTRTRGTSTSEAGPGEGQANSAE